MSDISAAYLADIRVQFEKQKSTAEAAAAQVDDAGFFASPDVENNSIAINVKHMGGNLRSRFTDFLTTDGEKPDRDRDGEFVIHPGETREVLLERWNAGWAILFRAVEALRPDDLLRTVRVRGEELTVLQALDRALVHAAYHVGQIVLLGRHYSGPTWQSLSIPRGGSVAYLQRIRAETGTQ